MIAFRSLRRALLRSSAGATLLAIGCSNLLGIEDNNSKVECLSANDCKAGLSCVDSHCVCEHDCGQGGGAGELVDLAGSGGAANGGSGGSQAGTGPNKNTGGESGMGTLNGGSGAVENGGSSTVPGHGGTGSPVGGSGAVVGSSGEAGEGQGGASQGGAGAGGESGSGECDPRAPSCLVCDETGNYVAGATPCAEACAGAGECVSALSCDGLGKICAGQDCCLTLPVPGNEFYRSCDDSCGQICPLPRQFLAQVSSFSLDAFEVTVGRFRRFVAQYPASKPAVGQGKNVNNVDDLGWDSSWSASLPATAQDLRDEQSDTTACDGLWSDAPEGNEAMPMNCVTWYEALAFCIWDGGRLPTEAEWNYAAAGGEYRVYPWSTPPDDASIDPSHAVYAYDTNPPIRPAQVGSDPDGRGRWFHYDLAGNVSEWMWDGYTDCYTGTTGEDCHDCGTTLSLQAKVTRGGAFTYPAEYVAVQTRIVTDAAERSPLYGFRCARNL